MAKNHSKIVRMDGLTTGVMYIATEEKAKQKLLLDDPLWLIKLSRELARFIYENAEQMFFATMGGYMDILSAIPGRFPLNDGGMVQEIGEVKPFWELLENTPKQLAEMDKKISKQILRNGTELYKLVPKHWVPTTSGKWFAEAEKEGYIDDNGKLTEKGYQLYEDNKNSYRGLIND